MNMKLTYAKPEPTGVMLQLTTEEYRILKPLLGTFSTNKVREILDNRRVSYIIADITKVLNIYHADPEE